MKEEHEITPAIIAEARKNPNGYIYKIEGEFKPEEAVPRDCIVGAWKVNEKGNITGDFIPNTYYRAKRKLQK